jgi:hypothetical protein
VAMLPAAERDVRPPHRGGSDGVSHVRDNRRGCPSQPVDCRHQRPTPSGCGGGGNQRPTAGGSGGGYKQQTHNRSCSCDRGKQQAHCGCGGRDKQQIPSGGENKQHTHCGGGGGGNKQQTHCGGGGGGDKQQTYCGGGGGGNKQQTHCIGRNKQQTHCGHSGGGHTPQICGDSDGSNHPRPLPGPACCPPLTRGGIQVDTAPVRPGVSSSFHPSWYHFPPHMEGGTQAEVGGAVVRGWLGAASLAWLRLMMHFSYRWHVAWRAACGEPHCEPRTSGQAPPAPAESAPEEIVPGLSSR